MNVAKAIRARLIANTSATYTQVGTRIYPGRLPDGATLPAIMYKRRKGGVQHIYNIDQTIDHTRAPFEIHCYAGEESYDKATAAAEAVIADLEAFRQAYDDMTIHAVFINDQSDVYDGTNKRQCVTVDIEVWYN